MAMNINSRKAHGGKVKGFGVADGNAPASSDMQPTPAPVKKFVAPDVISRPRAPINAGYGMSGGAENPSSLAPGQQLLSPMAEVLKQDSDDGEGVLDTIIREGTKQDDLVTGQLRDIGDKNVPTHPAMKSQTARPGGTYDFDTLPATVGASAAQPVRQPDDGK